MIDLKLIEKEINILSKQLNQKQNELKKATEDNFKEQYGDNFGCHNCAYGCCVDVGDYHTYCTKGNCILCRNYCDEYMPDNELSIYIRNKNYFRESALSSLNNLFGVSDIMQKPELHSKALDVLKTRDAKEKVNEEH